MPIRITIEVALMTDRRDATAIAGHLLDQLRHFLGDPIGLRRFSTEQRR
jgi:hypothetical protein